MMEPCVFSPLFQNFQIKELFEKIFTANHIDISNYKF